MCKNIKKYVFFVLIIGFCFSGCNNSAPPPEWDKCLMTKAATDESSLPAADSLVVYLDTSASMSGYVAEKKDSSFALAPDKETIYSKTLLEIKTLVTSLSPQPDVLVRTVSSDISQPQRDDLNISRAAFYRSVYTGQETNLAGALKLFTQPLDSSGDQNPPRFHILVTDGVQSSKGQNQTTACENGSDWRCVKAKVKEMLDKGWSGSILAIKSEFQGYIYTEIESGKIKYDSGKEPGRFRPFYLYILSPNQSEVKKLINGLKKRLNQIAQDNKIKREQLFREYPLMPKLAGDIVSSAVIAQADSSFLEVNQEDNKAQFEVLVDTKTATSGEKPFSIKINIPWSEHISDMANPAEAFNLIKWEIEKVPIAEQENHRYPELRKTGENLLSTNEVEIKLSAGWSDGVGTKDWRMYRLIGKLDWEANPPWLVEWSTKDDRGLENASKTLNLESSFANLWDNKTMRNIIVAELCLRVGDK